MAVEANTGLETLLQPWYIKTDARLRAVSRFSHWSVESVRALRAAKPRGTRAPARGQNDLSGGALVPHGSARTLSID